MSECEFGRMVEQRVIKLEEAIIDLRNHFSQRLPAWASVIIAILTAIIGGLIGVRI